jgi:glycosyltransferase involved in cell wall biosynthesis
MPEVTVIIPTRNRRELLLSMGLRSARDQQDVDHEVIVVDDGSTDGTAAAVQAIGDPRVTVLMAGGQGAAHARNVGIAAASAGCIAFLDDDDAWSPRKLRKQIDVLSETQADFVYSPALLIDRRHVPLSLLPAPDPGRLDDDLRERNAMPAGGSNVVVRTELIRRLGGFDESLLHLEDWDLWLRMGQVARGAVCDEILVAYLCHEDNLVAFESDATPEFQRIMERYRLRKTDAREAALAGVRWRAFALRRAGERVSAARVYARSAVALRSPMMLVRGVAALFGEAVMDVGARRRLRKPVAPPWLSLYQMSDG